MPTEAGHGGWLISSAGAKLFMERGTPWTFLDLWRAAATNAGYRFGIILDPRWNFDGHERQWCLWDFHTDAVIAWGAVPQNERRPPPRPYRVFDNVDVALVWALHRL